MRAIMRGLTDVEFERLYGTEEACLAALVVARQQAGMTCPRCGHAKSYVYGRRVGCTRCGARWTVTARTVMADTKLPLTMWFRAMHLMSSTKQGISAAELGRRLGVGYETAWYLHKRLRRAMTEREARYRLGGPDEDGNALVVEADDIYLGGERNQGKGTAGKAHVVVACERAPGGRMGHVAMRLVSGFSKPQVRLFRDAHLAPKAAVHTDGLWPFGVFAEAGGSHVATVTRGRRPSRQRGSPFFTVNTLVSNLSTALKATHKKLSIKHLPDYLGAFCWTTNRRRNMPGMIHALCRALATSSPVTRKAAYT